MSLPTASKEHFGAVRPSHGVDLALRCRRMRSASSATTAPANRPHPCAAPARLSPDTAAPIAVGGADLASGYCVAAARTSLGIRCVFQELSLCPNLDGGRERPRPAMPSLKGFGWRAPSRRRLILAKLDEIFPGHGIAAPTLVGDLAIAERQMVEIAARLLGAPTRR